MVDFKKKRNIINLVIWILACITAGVFADLACIQCRKNYIQNQFVDATIYGYLIVACLLFTTILAGEDLGEKTMLVTTFGGAVLNLVGGILLMVCYSDEEDYLSDSDAGRLICCGIICAVIGVLYLFEFLAGLFNKKLLD